MLGVALDIPLTASVTEGGTIMICVDLTADISATLARDVVVTLSTMDSTGKMAFNAEQLDKLTCSKVE